MSQQYGEPPRPSEWGPVTPFRQAIEAYRANGGAHHSPVKAVGGLGGDELDVVGMVIERLKAGRLAYGPFDLRNDMREFDAEATDECLDAAVYLAAGLLRRRMRG